MSKKELSNEEGGYLTVDVFRDGNNIVVQSTLAGIDPKKDIDISISHDRVTIRGERQSEHEIKDSDYYHRELYWGAFSRSIILPSDIDPDKATASHKNGVLTIRMPIISKHSGKR